MYNFVVNITPTDGVAPLGAGSSAGRMMTKDKSHLNMGLAPEEFKILFMFCPYNHLTYILFSWHNDDLFR